MKIKWSKSKTIIVIVCAVILLAALVVCAVVFWGNNSSNSSITANGESSSANIASDVSEEKESQNENITKVFPFNSPFQMPEFKAEVFYDSQNGNTIPYQIALPLNYNSSKKYPVILFLHGAEAIGDDNHQQVSNITNMFEYNGDFTSGAFVVCPQSSEWWDLDRYTPGDQGGTLGSVLHLLEELGDTYSFDSNRIYVTGFSMGGFATWSLLEEYGDIFAAGIPICGGGNEANAYRLTDIPIRIYHSTDDPMVSFSGSESMYNAIFNAGGEKAEFIILNGLGHNSWDYAFSDREGFSWLFAQSKKNPSGEYKYIPYFKVADSKGKTVIWDEDIEMVDYTVSHENDKYIATVYLYLKESGANKLSKAYKSGVKNEYTVYWSNQKMYSYTADKSDNTSVLVIENILSGDNVSIFSNSIEKGIEKFSE